MTTQKFMSTQKQCHMSIVSINPQDKVLKTQQSNVQIDENLTKFANHHNNDSSSQSQSIVLKSSRFQNLNFLKKQSKKFKSLKCSIRRNPDIYIHQNSNEKQDYNQITFQKKSANTHQTFLRDSLQKNSLMNKILCQQRKANNPYHLKNSLFQSLQHRQGLNSLHLKDHLKVSNQKMIALLSQRPFHRKSSFGIPFGKLKMAKNIKQFQRRNAHFIQSLSFVDSNRKNSQRGQNDTILKLSQLKKVSIDSFEKISKSKNDSLKRIIMNSIQSSNNSSSSIKLQSQRYSQHLKNHQSSSKNHKKKFLLTISDNENDLESSLGVSVQMTSNQKKKVRTQPCDTDEDILKTKSKKCQQKVMSDLVKLQKIRNQKIVSNYRGQTQLKNTKTNFDNANNNSKIISHHHDRPQENSSKKSKYIIKFKTQPNQNPLQKLKTRISYEIKDDELKRKRSIKNQLSQMHELHGHSKVVQRKNLTQLSKLHHHRQQKDKKVKLASINHKINYLQKQLSGWDISQQTEVKQNWQLNNIF